MTHFVTAGCLQSYGIMAATSRPFSMRVLLLWKLTSSEPRVIQDLPAELRDSKSTQAML